MPSLQVSQVAPQTYYPQSAVASDGVWREGNLIVFKLGSVLPGRCLRTNATVSGPKKRVTLHWHPTWVFALVTVHVLLYLIVAKCLRRSIMLEIAMSPEMIRRRNRLYLTGGVLILSGFFEFLLGTMRGSGDVLQILVGFVAFLTGIIVTAIAGQTLTIQRMEDDYVWLKGASPAYLKSLSEWRGMPPS